MTRSTSVISIVVTDDRNAGLVDLLDGRHQSLVVDRNEHEGIWLLDDPVLDQASLLLDIVGFGGCDSLDGNAKSFAGLFRADAAGLPEWICHVFDEERDGSGLSCLRASVLR